MTVIMTLLAIVLWCIAAGVNGELQLLSESVSVRWNHGGVSPAALARHEGIELEDGAENRPEVTLWQEKTAQPVSDGGERESSCDVITAFGDCGEITAADMLFGSFPAKSDTDGCAVSSALAFALWGSVDVLGMQICIGDEVLYVRGVLDDEKNNTLLRQAEADSDAALQNMQIKFESGGSRAEAENWLNSAGFSGGEILDMPLIGWASSAVLNLPAMLLVVCVLCRVIYRAAKLRRYPLLLARYIPLGVAIAAGAFFCMNAIKIPARLIPTMWSDFEFWKSLFSGFLDNITSWLTAASTLRDREIWSRVLALIFLAPVSGVLLVVAARRVKADSYGNMLIYCAGYMSALCVVSGAVSLFGAVAFDRGMYLVPCVWICADFCLRTREKRDERIENYDKEKLTEQGARRLTSAEIEAAQTEEKPREYAAK